MLFLLNIDCILGASSYDANAAGGLGVPAFEAALATWPPMRIVITSEMRYRMTIEQLRDCFSPRFRPQVVGTTLLYGALAHGPRLTREQEIADWLWQARASGADWIALDNRVDDFVRHADRLVACPALCPGVISELQTRLLLHAVRQEAALAADVDAPPRRVGQPPAAPGPAGPGPRAGQAGAQKPMV